MRVLEFIHRVEFAGMTVRVWAKRDEQDDFRAALRQRDAIEAALSAAPPPMRNLADAVALLPFCNAVEVSGNDLGLLVYPDWP